MKRLKVYEDGYMPLWQADLAWLQEGIEKVVTQFAKAFAFDRSRYIVTGCEITMENGTFTLSEGLVMYDGELLHVPKQTASTGLPNPKAIIVREETFDPAGVKVFELTNGQESRNTYYNAYGKLVIVDFASDPDASLAAGGDTLTETLKQEINKDPGWQDLQLVNEWRQADGTDIKPQYRRIGNVMYFRGEIQRGGGGAPIESMGQNDSIFANIGRFNTQDNDLELTLMKDGLEYGVKVWESGLLQDIKQMWRVPLNQLTYAI